jgi:hypothetical protein
VDDAGVVRGTVSVDPTHTMVTVCVRQVDGVDVKVKYLTRNDEEVHVAGGPTVTAGTCGVGRAPAGDDIVVVRGIAGSWTTG